MVPTIIFLVHSGCILHYDIIGLCCYGSAQNVVLVVIGNPETVSDNACHTVAQSRQFCFLFSKNRGAVLNVQLHKKMNAEA